MMRIVLLPLLSFLALAASAQAIPRPEVKKDDSWTYRGTNAVGPGQHIYVTEVTHVDEKTIITVTTVTDGKDIATVKNAREIDSTWTRDWNAIITHTGRIYVPHAGTFKFSLEVGSAHDISYELRQRRDARTLLSGVGRGEVVGWEDVEVPAGKFRALKVKQRANWQVPGVTRPSIFDIVFWYVPEIRRWVKLETTSNPPLIEELVSYELAH